MWILAAAAVSSPMPSGSTSQGVLPGDLGQQQEFAETNSAKGGSPASAAMPSASPQPSAGWRPPARRCRRSSGTALELRRGATPKNTADLHQRMADQVQHPRQVGDRPAQPEGDGGEAHMLDAAPGEQPPGIPPPPQREGRQQQRGEAERRQGSSRAARRPGWRRRSPWPAAPPAARRSAAGRTARRKWRAAPRPRHPAARNAAAPAPPWCRSRPAGRRRRATACPGRSATATARSTAQDSPCRHARQGLRRQVQHDGAEQRQGDADAAQDEELPRRLDRRRRAMHRHHQHGGQGGDLDRHPHDPELSDSSARNCAPMNTWKAAW